jgi:hypothetical protein
LQIEADKERVASQVVLFKEGLLLSASADTAAVSKSTCRIAIVNWVELLFGERVDALKEAITTNNFLRSCTCNMIQCGGDKSSFLTNNADGTMTSSRCRECLVCPESTCIFALMSTAISSHVFGHATTSVGGQLEHEHIVPLATVVFVFLQLSSAR